jgi:hypothetical protein
MQYNTIKRLKELVEDYENNMKKVRKTNRFDKNTRMWTKNLRHEFQEEVIQLIKRLNV